MKQKLPQLREYLRANLFDGSEDGSSTMLITTLLDEVTEQTFQWLLYDVLNGREDLSAHMKEYYEVNLGD